MPVVVPNLEAPTVQAEPLPGRAFPRVSDEASPATFGAAEGAGLERASEDVGEVEARQKTQHDNLRVIDANTQLEAWQDAALYGQAGPDGKQQGGAFSLHGADAINLPAKILPAYQEQAQKIASTLTPDQQEIFQRHIAAGANKLNLQLNRYEFQESNRLTDEIHTNALDQAVSSAALGWRDPIALGQARADIKAVIQLDDRLNAPQKEIQTRAQLARMDGAVVDNMLAAGNSAGARAYFEAQRSEIAAFNPKVAEEMDKNIRAGQVQDATNSVLTAYRSSLDAGAKAMQQLPKSGLTPDEQSRVIQGVDRGRADYAQQVRQDPVINGQITALDARIAKGETLPTDVGTVDALWRKGAYTDDQRLLARDSVLRASKQGAQDQADLDYVKDAYENRTPLDDKRDQKKVNLYTAYATMGMAPGSAGYNNVATEVTARLGVIPTAAIGFGRASLVGGDPEQAAQGAQLLASLQRANPRAYLAATDPETRAMAASVNDAVSAGATPEAAVTMARDNAQRSKTMQKFLDDAWNKELAKGASRLPMEQNLIRDGLKDDPAFTEPGFHFGNTVPDVPASMAGDFQTLRRDYFNHTGNLQQATSLAINDLKGTWGVSTVNGSRQLMKYAPEAMVPGLTADDIHADLAKEGYGAARLVESPETGSSGGRVWSLAEPDKFGAWDVVRDDKGAPVRYQLPKPDSSKTGFEEELKTFDEEQRLSRQRQRENFAAEHPLRQPGF